MKRILIALLVVTLLLCGCGKKETEEETQQRFVIEYQQRFSVWGGCYIIRDTENGKTYLFVKDGYAGGLTILEEGET